MVVNTPKWKYLIPWNGKKVCFSVATGDLYSFVVLNIYLDEK